MNTAHVRISSTKAEAYCRRIMAIESDDEFEFHCVSQRMEEKPLSSMDIVFITEVRKCYASDFPPATLRQLILALQKYLDINRRLEKFLSDVEYKVCHIYTDLLIVLTSFY